jgi:hypothetical protein
MRFYFLIWKNQQHGFSTWGKINNMVFCSPLNIIEIYDLNKPSLFVSFTMVANCSVTIVLIIWQSGVYCVAICLPIALTLGAWGGFYPPFGLGLLSPKP